MLPLILLSLAGCALSVPLETYIIGGNEVTPANRYPFVASLRLNSAHICGGTIISDQWILTAAHCLSKAKLPEDLQIVVGSNSLSMGGIFLDAESFVIHPGFFQKNIAMMNDIGLVKVRQRIEYSANIQPITLCDREPFGSQLATVVGWGNTAKNDDTLPDKLQYLEYSTVSWFKCFLNHFPTIVWCNFICAQSTPLKGVCFGDSGGPMVYDNKQIGIVSWVSRCAEGKPDVYTNVCKYKSWIINRMK